MEKRVDRQGNWHSATGQFTNKPANERAANAARPRLSDDYQQYCHADFLLYVLRTAKDQLYKGITSIYTGKA